MQVISPHPATNDVVIGVQAAGLGISATKIPSCTRPGSSFSLINKTKAAAMLKMKWLKCSLLKADNLK